MYIQIIVARYNENIQWLYTLLQKNQRILATIYNDGDYIDVPSELRERIIVKTGDHVPCEPTKYTQYILENWDQEDNEEDVLLVFLQGDPLYHNPTMLRVFDYIDKWDKNYQNLTLYPHPPCTRWGCSKNIEDGTAPNITYFANDARVWCDTNMDDNFNGSYFYDVWIKELLENRNITISNVCNTLGFVKPNGNIPKSYSAMFATSWTRIKKHPSNVWQNLHNFVIKGCDTTRNMSQKYRACIVEYMWAVLLHEG